ncbi:MAG TPA: squalene synthase HpnC [Candidatus Binatia bacterium]|nr:squalene synthase HpnC [Candidatus Binatia bacterium]
MSSTSADNRVYSVPPPDAAAAGWQALPPEYAIPGHAPGLQEAQQYCGRLARSHYENFSVVTWFLPKQLRQHFYNVYAYCRISDDLGDEVGNPQQALALLDAWEAELNGTYLSLVEPAPRDIRQNVDQLQPEFRPPNPVSPRHPVFVALRETIRQFDIPREPFANLLTAFRQDQTVTRYPTFEDLLGYCRNSANPVGHLVLYVCGYRDAERQLLSDYTCTALQLANFWQDVAVDYGKGRIYLPLDSLARFGVSEIDIAGRRATPQFREMMRFEVARAREWFHRGLPLAGEVDGHLAIDISMFSRGGLEILNAIERQGYDVLTHRPVIPKPRKLWLLVQAVAGKIL